MSLNHRIQYLRDRKGQPVGCVAIKLQIQPGSDNDLVVYQTSILNPLDRFDRAVARQLALGRMVEKPLTVRVPTIPTMYEVSEHVMMDIASDPGQPTRARQAAKRWLRNNNRSNLNKFGFSEN